MKNNQLLHESCSFEMEIEQPGGTLNRMFAPGKIAIFSKLYAAARLYERNAQSIPVFVRFRL